MAYEFWLGYYYTIPEHVKESFIKLAEEALSQYQ